jgi:spoIIIJ-associated protein
VEQSGVRASEPATDEGQVTPIEAESFHAEETKLDTSPPAEALEASEAPQDLILAADEFCTKLLSAMGLDGTVDAYDGGEVIVVDLTAKETGLLIGQKGETLDAIQYLLNLAIYKNRPFLKRIVVDSEGYRQRRAEAIRGMANRTARRVVREQRPLDLPPMSAAERRVVHLFLQENPGVSTSSKGKGEERRVVVSPA